MNNAQIIAMISSGDMSVFDTKDIDFNFLVPDAEPDMPQSPLGIACAKGDSTMVEGLLAVPNIDPLINDHEALIWAARNGHLDVVQRLLELDEVSDTASAQENLALINAAENGHLEIVERLLELDEVSDTASAQENLALIWAAENGHIEIVERLLELPRVSDTASAQENIALINAIANSHLEIVECLLRLPGVIDTASAQENQALINAAENGHLEIVERLLELPRVSDTASAQENLALIWAAENGHLDVVQRLLDLDEVSDTASAQENLALISALDNGHLEIVERLLYCRSVSDNATAQDNYALRSAARNGYDDIFRDLLYLHHVQYKAAALDNDALRSAASNGHIDIVQSLLEVPEVEAHARLMMEKLYLSVVEGEIKDVKTSLPHISYLAPVIHHLRGRFPNGFFQIKTLAATTKKWEIFNLLETHLRDNFSMCSAGNVNFLLLQAVKSNQKGAVQRILANGARANIIAMMEHRICIAAWENKNPDIFEMLLARLDTSSMGSLLEKFILMGDINAVDRLCQLDLSDSSIADGILLSSEQNDLKMLDRMLQHPADMQDQNILKYALASCSLEGLAKLLEHEAIARPTNINDVLLAAISRDNPDILARLLDLPAINQNLAAFFSDEILEELEGKANPNMIFNIAKVHFPDGVKGNASISQKWKTLIHEGYKEDHGVDIAEKVITARLSGNPESLSLSSLPPVEGGTAGLIATFTHRGSSRPLPPKDDTPLPDDVTKEAKGSPKKTNT